MRLSNDVLQVIAAPEKQKRVAIALAMTGILLPGLHKFYLRQRAWGIVYLLLLPTHIPQAASLIEAVWYGLLDADEFDYNFNSVHSVSTSQSKQSLSPNETGSEAEKISKIDKIDVNRATEEDWHRVPLLSEEQGRSLVALRKSGVQFHCLEDLAAALSVPVEQLQPLASMLKFYYYDSVESDVVELNAPQPVNLNQASIAALTAIPGVDVALALQIVHHRTRQPFKNLTDLHQRLLLNAETVEQIMHYVQF